MGQDPATPPDPLRPMPTGASGPEEHDALHQPSTPSLTGKAYGATMASTRGQRRCGDLSRYPYKMMLGLVEAIGLA